MKQACTYYLWARAERGNTVGRNIGCRSRVAICGSLVHEKTNRERPRPSVTQGGSLNLLVDGAREEEGSR